MRLRAAWARRAARHAGHQVTFQRVATLHLDRASLESRVQAGQAILGARGKHPLGEQEAEVAFFAIYHAFRSAYFCLFSPIPAHFSPFLSVPNGFLWHFVGFRVE
jgi:hypothetical protein